MFNTPPEDRGASGRAAPSLTRAVGFVELWVFRGWFLLGLSPGLKRATLHKNRYLNSPDIVICVPPRPRRVTCPQAFAITPRERCCGRNTTSTDDVGLVVTLVLGLP